MALQHAMPAMEYESVNPFDGKTLKTFVGITDEQLEKKLSSRSVMLRYVAAQNVRRTRYHHRQSVGDPARQV